MQSKWEGMDTTALLWDEMPICILRYGSSATVILRYKPEYLHLHTSCKNTNVTCVPISADTCNWLEYRFPQSTQERFQCFAAMMYKKKEKKKEAAISRACLHSLFAPIPTAVAKILL